MAATHSLNSTTSVAPVLYVAFELSNGKWKLASSTARGQRARIVSAPARDATRALRERLLGRFFAATRERLREVASGLGVHHLANLAGCPAR
jgi:hypothetical protein